MENTTTDDGVTVARGNYRTQASVAEVFMISAVVFINYMAGTEVGAPGTALPKPRLHFYAFGIKPGDTETQTVTLSERQASHAVCYRVVDQITILE